MITKPLVTRKYNVCLFNFDDLQSLYDDLEIEGRAPPNTTILRSVECIARRPMSKQTGYLLTESEAEQLQNDSRVKFVELYPEESGITITPAVTQYSTTWHKGATISSSSRNWSLLRSAEGKHRINWGRLKTESARGTINLQYTGKNVDIIICDGGSIESTHADYQKSDLSGSRVMYYNWFQHNPEVTGAAAGTFEPPSVVSHSMHVAGIAAGTLNGWAKDANIYVIPYSVPHQLDYIKEFHKNKPINPATGKKNPTIVNNSWGYTVYGGIFNKARSGAAYVRDITYRGTTYAQGNLDVTTPTTEYLQQTSGVCTATTLGSQLAGFENIGNKIRTSANITKVSTIASLADGGYFPATQWKITPNMYGSSATIRNLVAPRVQYINFTTHISDAKINLMHRGYGFNAASLRLELRLLNADTGDLVDSFYRMVSNTINKPLLYTEIYTSLVAPEAGNYTVEFRHEAKTLAGTINSSAYIIGSFGTDDLITDQVATVEQIPNALLGRANLIDCTSYNVFDEEDAIIDFYRFIRSDDTEGDPMAVPFNTYLFNQIFTEYRIGSDFVLSALSTGVVLSTFNHSNPAVSKIMLTSGRRSILSIFAGVEGDSAPNRTFRIRIEGHYLQVASDSANPSVVFEYTFYENDPSRIDLQIGKNDCVRFAVTTPRSLTWTECAHKNYLAGYGVPAQVQSVDEDVKELIDAGVIVVAAAGNIHYKIANADDQDWNNTVSLVYPAGSVTAVPTRLKYMQGMTPGRPHSSTFNNTNSGPIVVGAIDSIYKDQKASYSFCGPGITIYAPGTYITSAVPRPTSIVSGSYIGKMSGTSMACPQVVGVLACALEKYPDMTHDQAKAYIKQVASKNQINDNPGGWGRNDIFYLDDLQGSDNLYLRYPFKQKIEGQLHPTNDANTRPSSGVMYPRPKIKK